MRETAVSEAIKKRRLPLGFDFWIGSLMGTTLYGFFPVLLPSILIFEKFNLIIELRIFCLTLLSCLLLFRPWKNYQLKEIRNHNLRSVNHSDALKHLGELDWEYCSSEGIIYVSADKWYLRMLDIIIIPTKDGILYNFRYADFRGIRAPFFY